MCSRAVTGVVDGTVVVVGMRGVVAWREVIVVNSVGSAALVVGMCGVVAGLEVAIAMPVVGNTVVGSK